MSDFSLEGGVTFATQSEIETDSGNNLISPFSLQYALGSVAAREIIRFRWVWDNLFSTTWKIKLQSMASVSSLSVNPGYTINSFGSLSCSFSSPPFSVASPAIISLNKTNSTIGSDIAIYQGILKPGESFFKSNLKLISGGSGVTFGLINNGTSIELYVGDSPEWLHNTYSGTIPTYTYSSSQWQANFSNITFETPFGVNPAPINGTTADTYLQICLLKGAV